MAWGTFTESAILTVDDSFEFITDGTDAIVLALNPRETATFLFNVDAPGTTDDLEIEILQGHRINNGFDLDGVTSTSDVELMTASDPIAADGDLDGTYIIFTSGNAQGEGRLIVASVASDDGVNLSHAGTLAAAADTYARYRFSAFRFTMDPQSTVDSDNQNNDGITVHAANGQYVAVVARATGATNAHRVQMSYQVDGVSV